jgi:hypothetical protein
METKTNSDFSIPSDLLHPDYIKWYSAWDMLADVVEGGADTVKEMGRKYLPATTGQLAQWSTPIPGAVVEDLGGGRYVGSSTGSTLGSYSYELYKYRAIFYEYPAELRRVSVGRLTFEDAKIELPSELAGMVDVASASGSSMQKFIEEVFDEQVKYSRCGVLADFAATSTTSPPYLSLYSAARVLNWNVERLDGQDVLKWVVLDESGYEAVGVKWEFVGKVRVCALDERGEYFTTLYNVDDIDLERQDLLVPVDELSVYPEFKGKKSSQIPFVFINATTNGATPEVPYMMSLANTSLALYRGEADYRQALFMQGQATPMFKGVSQEDVGKFLLGAQGSVYGDSEYFDAGFMEVSGAGLSEMRESQTLLHVKAGEQLMKLAEAGKGESGDALKERTDSQTVSLNAIVSAQEDALKRLFDIISDWGGVQGDIEIVLNREFNEGAINPDELVKMMDAYLAGAPITLEDVHSWAMEGGLTETSYEDVLSDMQETGRL